MHVDQWATEVSTPNATASAATVQARTTVVNNGGTAASVSVQGVLTAPDGSTLSPVTTAAKTIAAGASATFDYDVPVTNPKLWNLTTPNLYALATDVLVGGTPVSAGLADLAVTGDYPGYEIQPPSEVVAHPVVTEPTFAMLAQDDPLLGSVTESGELPIERIASSDWVISPDDDRGCDYLVGEFERRHGRPNLRHRAAGSVLTSLVRAGVGVGFAQATSPGRSGVTIQAIAGTPVWYRHVLLWRRNHPVAKHAGLLRKTAIDSYTNAISDNPTFQRWLARHDLATDPNLLFSPEAADPFSIARCYRRYAKST